MTTTDYLIDIALIAIVGLQVRPRRMDLRSLALPVVATLAAASYYLTAVPTAGHDVALYLVLGTVGGLLGAACALTTRVWRPDAGPAFARAGGIAAVLWVVGVGSRLAFSEYTTHGGGPAVARFSLTHHITGSAAWVTALLLMAVAEVVVRLVVLRVRGLRTPVVAAPDRVLA